jgi:hypothetical protein
MLAVDVFVFTVHIMFILGNVSGKEGYGWGLGSESS